MATKNVKEQKNVQLRRMNPDKLRRAMKKQGHGASSFRRELNNLLQGTQEIIVSIHAVNQWLKWKTPMMPAVRHPKCIDEICHVLETTWGRISDKV